MPDVSKPQGLFRRAHVWYYRRRVPQHLIASLGKKEMRATLETEIYKEAKIRRNEKAAEYDALFRCTASNAMSKTAINVKRTTRLSKKEMEARILRYVETKSQAERETLTRTEWSNDPEGRDPRDVRDEVLLECQALVEFYQDASRTDTRQAIYAAELSIFGRKQRLTVDDRLELEEMIRRALIEIEIRSIAWFKPQSRDVAFDPLFVAPRAPTFSLTEVIEKYLGSVFS